jgi:hypothetical protein
MVRIRIQCYRSMILFLMMELVENKVSGYKLAEVSWNIH